VRLFCSGGTGRSRQIARSAGEIRSRSGLFGKSIGDGRLAGSGAIPDLLVGSEPNGQVNRAAERLPGEQLRRKSRAGRICRAGNLRVLFSIRNGLPVGEGFGLSPQSQDWEDRSSQSPDTKQGLINFIPCSRERLSIHQPADIIWAEKLESNLNKAKGENGSSLTGKQNKKAETGKQSLKAEQKYCKTREIRR